MAASAEIYFEHDRWGRALAWSAGLHVGFTLLLFGYSAIFYRTSGDTWGAGGGGEAIGATLVSSVPLPVSAIATQNVLANESKGVTQSQPKIEEKAEPEAIDIQGKNAKLSQRRTRRRFRKPQPQPEPEPETNQVAFGEGGPVSGPYGTFNAAGAKGGFGFTGGGGDFGSRFAWYVQVVQRVVSQNWLKYEIDPRITSANRVYITFDIARDGHPAMCGSSNRAAYRRSIFQRFARIQRIDTFGPLPPDYSRQQGLRRVLVRLQEVGPCTSGP